MIDTPTAVWDPPPSRPSLAPTWIGLIICLIVVLLLTGTGVLGLRAAAERRYVSSAETCSAIVPVAVDGTVASPVEAGRPGTACTYSIRQAGEGRVGVAWMDLMFYDDALKAWAHWYLQPKGSDNARDVDGMGRAARLNTVLEPGRCTVQLLVLDSNVRLTAQVSFLGEALCANPDAIAAALADSTRASLGRLGELSLVR
ncbi:hypothetical protein AB0F81_07590 [Actinoplanes sp. NPDC024001]|uniref:hypothetical protein n=1 Tax=Actinoplanes sp. NPDC024001 TaxID=3154598 RepID=UPI0033D2A8D4